MSCALAEQLRFSGIADMTHQELRAQLVNYLTEHTDTAGVYTYWTSQDFRLGNNMLNT